MPRLLGELITRALDANGNPVSGARLYVFSAGTTTPVTTYSDASLTTPHAHPVVADSSGVFAPVYVSAGAYKIAVRTPAEAELPGSPVDNVGVEQADVTASSVTPTGGRFMTAAAAIPAVFVGANSGDERAALETVMAAAVAAGKELVIRGTVRLTTALTIPTGARLRFDGGVLDFSAASITSGTLVTATGVIGSGVSVTTAASPGDGQVSATSHGLVAGDWVRITSTLDAQESHAGFEALRLGDRTGDDLPWAETVRVLEAVNGDTIRIDRELLFRYPTGSTLQKVTPWTGVLDGVTINAGGLGSAVNAVTPFLGQLIQPSGVASLDIRNAKGMVILRGALPGDWRLRSRGIVNRALADNLHLLRLLDGCTGVSVRCDLAHGGQLADISYTPSNALKAPNIGCSISGVFADASLSCAVDHPGNWGTRFHDIEGLGVDGLVYARSRNALIQNVRGYCARRGDANTIGIWLGENGYWQGARINGASVYGFATGVSISGQGNTATRAVDLNGVHVEVADTAFSFGNVGTDFAATGVSIRGRGLSCARVANTGVLINGTHDGIELDVSLKGPFTVAPVEIGGVELLNAKITGEVIDAGAVPLIASNAGGSLGSSTFVDLRRIGTVQAPALTTQRVDSPRRTLSRIGTPFAAAANTTEQTVTNTLLTLPAGAVYAGTVLDFELVGLKTGTAGAITLRISAGATLIHLATIPAAAGAFRVRCRMASTSASDHASHISVEANAAITQSRTARTLDLSAASTWTLTAQLANSGDGLTIDHAEVVGSWV